MIRLIEPLVFGSLAVAGHLAVFSLSPAGELPSGGDGGAAVITLQGAPESVTALVEQWTRAPEVMTQVAMPVMEAAPQVSAIPAPQMERVALPQAPALAVPLARPDAVQLDTSPAAPPKPVVEAGPEPELVAKPAPAPKPVAKPKAKPSQPAAPSQKAAGKGKAGGQGSAAKSSSNGTSAKQAKALMVTWGSGIRARVERVKRYPRGSRDVGTVRLQLTVETSGRLTGVQVTGTSGSAALDRAALEAVKRARLPAAPSGMAAGRHVLALRVSFAR